MIIGNLDFQAEYTFMHEEELMLGFAVEKGETSCCNEEVVLVRLGFLLFTINILIQSAYHRH